MGQQEDDEWQVPDKWQRISQMVFHGGCLEIHPSDSGCMSRLILSAKEADVAHGNVECIGSVG